LRRGRSDLSGAAWRGEEVNSSLFSTARKRRASGVAGRRRAARATPLRRRARRGPRRREIARGSYAPAVAAITDAWDDTCQAHQMRRACRWATRITQTEVAAKNRRASEHASESRERPAFAKASARSRRSAARGGGNEPAKRRVRERVGESEGRSPSDEISSPPTTFCRHPSRSRPCSTFHARCRRSRSSSDAAVP